MTVDEIVRRQAEAVASGRYPAELCLPRDYLESRETERQINEILSAGAPGCGGAGAVRGWYDPADVAGYGPVRRHGAAHTATTSSVWGPAGDPPWPQRDRARRLRRKCARYRAHGWTDLADLAEAYAASGAEADRRAAALEAARLLVAERAIDRDRCRGGSLPLELQG